MPRSSVAGQPSLSRPSGGNFGSLHAQLPLVGRGQRIGLMGGSFNPPHEGHLNVAETAARRLRLDWVWWLVSPGNPLKSHRDLPPLAERIAAARRLAGQRRIKVSGLEAGLGTAFTTNTVAHLRRRLPDARFVWIMGADNLADLHRWRDWRGLAQLVPMAIVDRPGWRLRALSSPAGHLLAGQRVPEDRAATLLSSPLPAWTLLTTRLSPLSSTELRRRTAQTSAVQGVN